MIFMQNNTAVRQSVTAHVTLYQRENKQVALLVSGFNIEGPNVYKTNHVQCKHAVAANVMHHKMYMWYLNTLCVDARGPYGCPWSVLPLEGHAVTKGLVAVICTATRGQVEVHDLCYIWRPFLKAVWMPLVFAAT